MATVPNVRKVTYEEWLRMPEVSDGIEEVVNGEVRIMPAPEWSHREIIHNLYRLISSQVDRRSVAVTIWQFGLIVRRHPLTTRVPDLAVFKKPSIVEQDGRIHSAPQLVVEVLSPEERLGDYASLGVAEAWIVSPEARTVEILYLEEGRLRRAGVLAEGTLTPRHFPAISVDIAMIWPE